MIEIQATTLRTINLGHTGENDAVRVAFSLLPFQQTFPGGRPTLLVKRPKDAEAYPVPLEVDGTTAFWTVTDTDTETAGFGQAELQWYLGDVLAKSDKFDFTIVQALTQGDTPSDPQKTYYDNLLQKVTAAQDAAEDARDKAKGSADDAAAAATEAGKSASAAAADARTAGSAAATAGAAAQAADEAKGTAKQYAANAQKSAADAEAAKAGVEGNAIRAENAAKAASASQQRAAASATEAGTAKSAAQSSASAAAGSATAAGNSASAAAKSASDAAAELAAIQKIVDGFDETAAAAVKSVQDTGTAQVSAINSAAATAKQEISALASTSKNDISAASTAALTAIEEARTSALSKIAAQVKKAEDAASSAETDAAAAMQAKTAATQALSDLLAMLGTDVAPLVDGKLPIQYIPATATTEIYEITAESQLTGLAAQRGDLAELVETVNGERTITKTWQLLGNDASVRANWVTWGTSYAVQAGSATTATSAENATKINNHRMVEMTADAFATAVKDASTYYLVYAEAGT